MLVLERPVYKRRIAGAEDPNPSKLAYLHRELTGDASCSYATRWVLT